MIDANELCFQIQAQCVTYYLNGAWATKWNFLFMDNLYNFGKDFK